jgi:hypothetical protein
MRRGSNNRVVASTSKQAVTLFVVWSTFSHPVFALCFAMKWSSYHF